MQTMTHLADTYLERVRPTVAPQTLMNIRGPIKKMATEWDRTRRAPGKLNAVWLESFLLDLRKGERSKPVGPQAYNHKLLFLRKFIEWTMRRPGGPTAAGLLDLFVDMRAKEYKRGNFTRISVPEMHQLINGANCERERFVLALACFTLGRSSELSNVRVRDVSLDTQNIRWYRSKTDNYDDLPIMAPLEHELRRWLEVYPLKCPSAVHDGRLAGDVYLIPGRQSIGPNCLWMPHMRASNASLRGTVQRHLKEVLNIQHLKNEGCHVLRRSGARNLYDQLIATGAEDAIRVVGAMLGHASVRTTEGYLGAEADRRNRDKHLKGSNLLALPTDNVYQLRSVSSGD